ncbi:serine hydrolase domain-containing protein [Actinoplanes awajinensis]|uniref:D-alanyl-D-alanine carboxypeptidase n=1 Tax=Actinoplanes awajinensis subsp. mycoplanecinus TaxID=135947 RepID=A0A0X3V959_9ACTN|nr:serine hydrolase domain-containing protein [Actinoplanes awajinensis]KUL41315.1 D-alanyl-D-alanine carboxypeptidase [Actinoplanes awajinensis subsp. mycoplanecinus]
MAKKKTALTAICAGTVLIGLVTAGGTAANAKARTPGPPTGVREALQEAVAAGNPAVLSYVRTGTRSWHLAAGIADLAAGRPAQPDDHWRIFSNTKSFVSTVLLQLVGERRLSLDDSVERWLPGMLDGRKVSVRQLLNHTSGIYNPDNGTDRGGQQPRDVIAAALAHPPLSEPGQQWAYSDTNYLLAGLVIEAVTHHRADQEIRRRIIVPLGLSHTSFPLDDPAIPGPYLHGYDMSGRDVTGFNPSGEWTAGAMVSTTADLARFDSALFRGRLLRPAQQRELLTTALDSDYGLGVQRLTIPCEDNEVTVWETDGSGPGFTSLSMTTADATRQFVLVATVFDLGRGQRKNPAELPFPDARPAYTTLITSVLCP